MPKNATRVTSALALILLLVAAALYVNRTGDADDSATVAKLDNSATTTNEIIVAQSSGSITSYGWNEGPAYIPATADFYDGPVTKSTRPDYINDIVLHESLSENVGVRNGAYTGSGSGFSMGTVRSESTKLSPFGAPEKYHTDSGEIFHLTEDEELTAYVRFSAHGMNETILFTALIDYEQVEFELDGMNALLHEIRTPEGIDFLIPVNLGILSPGKHDIEIVIIPNPYDGYDFKIDEPSIYFPTNDYFGVRGAGQKWTAIVGDNDQPARQLLTRYSGSAPSTDHPLGYTGFFAKPGDTHPQDPENQIAVDLAETGTKYQFRTLTTRTSPTRDSKQVIMTFVDYHLVPVNGNDLLVVDLEVDQEVTVDTSIDMPNSPGIHQVFSYVVTGPYRVTPDDPTLKRYSHTSESTLAIKAS